jgi:hypothetical protein
LVTVAVMEIFVKLGVFIPPLPPPKICGFFHYLFPKYVGDFIPSFNFVGGTPT